MLEWLYVFAAGGFFGIVCAWPVGYAHREFVEMGRRWGRMLAWRRKYRRRGLLTCALRAYSGLFADIGRLWCTGRWT